MLFYENIIRICSGNRQGDTIILLADGHGFNILEDTKMIEVKQGPYLSQAEDNEMLEMKKES